MWIVLSVLSGIVGTGVGVSSRYIALHRTHDSRTVVFAQFFYSTAFYVPFAVHAVVVRGVSMPAETPWGLFLFLILIEAVSQLCMYQAIKRAPLSYVIPFLSFIPAVLLVVAYAVFGSVPSVGGIAGVLVVVIGIAFSSYCPVSVLRPGRVWFFAFASVLLWSATTTIQRIFVGFLDPALFGAVYFGGTAVALGLYHGVSGISSAKIFDRATILFFCVMGFSLTGTSILQFFALQSANPAYVIALKMSMGIAYLVWDPLFFREKLTRRRVLGNVLAIGGGVMVVLFA